MPLLPKILYKIVQSLKFNLEKIVTLPKPLLYVTNDVTCNHVICKPRTLIYMEIYGRILKITQKFTEKNGIVKLIQKIVSFLLRFQGGCTRL